MSRSHNDDDNDDDDDFSLYDTLTCKEYPM